MKPKNNNLTLAHLEIGAKARVVSIDGEDAISRRLLEMGVTPGASIRVIKNASFGCPMEIRIRNSHLALRRSEADSIVVNPES